MIENVYELSPLQEGMYYHWLAEDSSSLYFEQTSYRVRAKVLDIEKLKGAYDQLTARHAVLRTSFSNEYAGRSLQIVRKEVPSNFTYEKLGREAEQQVQIALIKQQDRERGFDLSRGSQMRLHVIDLSEEEYEFIWSHHHILMDGWCVSVLINDFNELMSAAIKGSKADLPPVIPYSNYINWLKTIDRERSLGYWKDYLKDYSSPAEIPFKAATKGITYIESSEHLQIKGDLFKKIDALCTQLSITQNTFVQGVWGYLLSRYNNTHDVVFGAVVSGRPADLPGVEEMIGLFSNTIPVRVQYEPDDTPVELLKSLQEQSIESSSHHYMNLAEVQSQSDLGMELMDHIMIFENYAVKELENEGALNTKSEEGLSIESRELFERTNYDFNILVSSSNVSLSINIKYNLSIYDGLLLKNLMKHFEKLINEFAQNPDQSLRAIDYLSDEEKHKLLVTFNDTAVAYPKDKTIVDLFEEQVTKTPDTIAVVFEETALTYRELNERSNQLAHYLRTNYDIQPDDLVGIKQERSEWMIVSVLGVLKAGGAYVPIDPDYPQERIDYIEQDANCKVCVDETELSKFRESQARYSKEPVTATPKEDHLAYVIYTSGSTGRPKGVMIAHKGIYNRLLWAQNFYRFTADDRILQKTTFCFDVSVWELLWPLLAGARLVFAKPGGQGDTNYLLQLIERENITALHFVPSMLEQFLMAMPAGRCTGLKKVLCSGEALKALHVHLFREKLPHAALHNLYGPTEASIDVTYWAMPEKNIEESRTVPIGRPVSNTQIFILEKNGKPVPVGVAGEICIGGVQLANGYLNKPELTRERFVEHPFLTEKGIDKIYRTGDLGRWLPDGEIEFLGRQDNQVKIRGFRIEPDEVAFVLLQCPLVKQAVVVVAKGADGDRLVAYIVPNNAFDKTGIVTYMQARLPSYMIPGILVEIPFVPLTLSGKLDRKALPDIVLSHEYEEPVNDLEWELCAIWQMLLGVDKVGRRDNFFELGGHSILAIRMIAAIRSKLLTDIRVNEIFRNPTVAALAEQIKLARQPLSGENEEYEEITI